MPRQSFFDEFKKRYICRNCKDGMHEDCEFEVIVGDPTAFHPKKKPCQCNCQLSPADIHRREMAKRVTRHTRK